MSIDVANLSSQMIAAARGVVGGQGPATQKYFESEVRIFAERFATIELLRASGAITEARARSHIEMQKTAWESVLLAVAGLNQLMVEQALNAALDAARPIVNAALGFVLL